MKRPKIRQARALAAANRRAYLQFGIGAAVGIALFAVALVVVPIGSPSQMVKAQVVHAKTTGSALETRTMPTPPAVAPTLGPTSAPPPEAPAPAASVHAAAQPARISVGFDQLSAFPFEVTDQMADGTTDAATASRKTLAQIPAAIKALNDKEVSVRGYMLPLNFQKGLLPTFSSCETRVCAATGSHRRLPNGSTFGWSAKA